MSRETDLDRALFDNIVSRLTELCADIQLTYICEHSDLEVIEATAQRGEGTLFQNLSFEDGIIRFWNRIYAKEEFRRIIAEVQLGAEAFRNLYVARYGEELARAPAVLSKPSSWLQFSSPVKLRISGGDGRFGGRGVEGMAGAPGFVDPLLDLLRALGVSLQMTSEDGHDHVTIVS